MKTFGILIIKAFIIAMACASVGLISNLASDEPTPWIFVAPKEIELAGVKVRLIDENQAVKYLGDGVTVFIDSRECIDYLKSHVKGAICLPPDDLEQRLPSIEPLIQPDTRLILYCYGPECDMAERVGTFLAQIGYTNMMIMSSGFRSWEKAGYPIEERAEKGTAIEDPEDRFMEEELPDEVIASRLCRCLDPYNSRSKGGYC